MKKLKYFILTISVAFSLGKSMQAYAEVNEKRIYGNSRYSTAVEISKCGWEKSDKLIIATGEDFPDALCAAPLAKKLNAPILLTEKDCLKNEVLDEIKRLKVKDAYIIGGQGAISDNVKNQLQELRINCKRLYGDNKYATSVEVAKEMGAVSELVLVTGENFPDALAIAPIAAAKGMPIVLTMGENPPEVVKAYISSNNINKSYIIGGTSVIGSSTENLLKNSTRISGENRYDTNISIIKKFNDINSNSLYIATGENFPDALAGAVLAAKEASPIVLLNNDVDKNTENYIVNNISSIKNINILGGENAVSDISIKRAKGEVQKDTNDYFGDSNSNQTSSKNEKFDYEKYRRNIDYFEKYGQIKASIDKDHIEVGDKFKLNFEIINKPEDCNEKPFFRIAMESTATIDNSGNIEALKEGLAHAEVFFYGKSSGDIPVFIYNKSTPAPANDDELFNIIRDKLLKGEDGELKIDTHKAKLNSRNLDLSTAFEKVLSEYGDYAEYISGMISESSAGIATIGTNYVIPYDEVIEHRNIRDEKAKQIVNSIIKTGMSDHDKVKVIHDYVVNNTQYDVENYIKRNIPKDSYTSYGALVKGNAVCEGYARAIQHLCRISGIECYIVSGTTPAGRHAWNIVKVDGKYRHVDATFDDPVAKDFESDGFLNILRHDYFMLTDEQIAPTRQWDRSKYPVCN